MAALFDQVLHELEQAVDKEKLNDYVKNVFSRKL